MAYIEVNSGPIYVEQTIKLHYEIIADVTSVLQEKRAWFETSSIAALGSVELCFCLSS